MSAPLYDRRILRLATEIPHHARLPDPMGTAEKRSVVCGSQVTVDADLDDEGRIGAIGLAVRACALGQASSSLLSASAVGRTPEELAEARDGVAAWLAGAGDPPAWPGVDALAPALPHTARHAAIRLPFEAAAEAAERARAAR